MCVEVVEFCNKALESLSLVRILFINYVPQKSPVAVSRRKHKSEDLRRQRLVQKIYSSHLKSLTMPTRFSCAHARIVDKMVGIATLQ